MPEALLILEVIGGILAMIRNGAHALAEIEKVIEGARQRGGLTADDLDRIVSHRHALEDRLLSKLQTDAGGTNDTGIPEPAPAPPRQVKKET